MPFLPASRRVPLQYAAETCTLQAVICLPAASVPACLLPTVRSLGMNGRGCVTSKGPWRGPLHHRAGVCVDKLQSQRRRRMLTPLCKPMGLGQAAGSVSTPKQNATDVLSCATRHRSERTQSSSQRHASTINIWAVRQLYGCRRAPLGLYSGGPSTAAAPHQQCFSGAARSGTGVQLL